MTIENHSIRDEPSTLPAWLVVAGILIAVVLISIGMVMDRFAGAVQ
jgi:hypothetical protein